MPLYEYECAACGNHFEVRQRIVEDPISVCPTCGGPTRRLLHPVGIIFKGSGWYITDSRKTDSATSARDSSDRATTSSDTSKSTSSDRASASSDSKPAASTTT